MSYVCLRHGFVRKIIPQNPKAMTDEEFYALREQGVRAKRSTHKIKPNQAPNNNFIGMADRFLKESTS